MDKHKEIAEKITYALDGYISDHNNRNFGDADGWLRHIRNGWEDFIEAHPDCLNFHEYLQHQQSKVEELQCKLDATKRKINELSSIAKKARNSDYYTESGRNAGLNIAAEIEQALKGECKHESDGTNRLSLPPKTRCWKCGEFYSVHELKDGDQ